MIDTALQFFDKQLATSTATSEALDFRQADPDLGMLDTPELHVSVVMTTPWAGGSSPVAKFELQDCDTKMGSYKTFLTVEAPATFEQLDIPFPVKHRRYVKLKLTTTGSPSAGNCSAFVTDGTEKNPYYKREI